MFTFLIFQIAMGLIGYALGYVVRGIAAARRTPEPDWIVNDNGELGVKIHGRCFFLYKGRSFEYPEGKHDDGSQMVYRPVGKREFGEVCHPDAYHRNLWNTKDRYTEPLFEYNIREGTDRVVPWKPVPRKV